MRKVSNVRSFVGAFLASSLFASVVASQLPVPTAMPGEEAAPDELAAWELAQAHNFPRAREAAEAIVRRTPTSYVGHFVLGYVFQYGEANFPKSLFHEELALALFEAQNGAQPGPDRPWRWHAKLLRLLAITHGELEHFRERLDFQARYDHLYDPDIGAERAWALMKLSRFEEARLAARQGIATGEPDQIRIGLNALCAIEFEAGDDQASYVACRQALDYGRATGSSEAVDFTNFAEAARGAFDLALSEEMALEATRLDVVAYGNPWLDLADLYVREARFPEALSALREVPRYRAQRPPHIRDSDRNEGRRGLSAFYLAIGRHEDALRITEQALVAPDRRYHNSRDPDQDEAIAAMLDRAARRLAARRVEEDAAAKPWYERLLARFEAAWLRIEAFSSARRASRVFEDDDKLVGFFRIGTAKSAVTPPWLVGELVDIVGAGVVKAAVARARSADRRALAPSYYDAFDAEAAIAAGDAEDALRYADRALAGLPPGEALLRARMQVVIADAHDDLGNDDARVSAIELALSIEPGTVRRLDVPVPVRFEGGGDAVVEDVLDALGRSPAFEEDEGGLPLRVERAGGVYRACLLGRSGAVLGCGERAADLASDRRLFTTWMLESTHAAIFAPRIDLSQADIGSLDGSNAVSRDGLRTLFDSLGRDADGNAPPAEVVAPPADPSP